MRKREIGIFIFISILLFVAKAKSQTIEKENIYVLKPTRIFDGENLLEDHWVMVKGEKIEAVKKASEISIPKNAIIIDLPNQTLLPGLIEGHSHLLLHPYNETSWDEQVLKESSALRVIRAVNHAKATLLAGFTTVRDLGTEGAGYDDVGIKTAINQGLILCPRMIVATRAIVATGSYAPKGFAPQVEVPQGAEEADGVDNLIKVVRTQIGKGADLIKVYADYRWGLFGEARPTFSIEELKLIVETAKSSGRPTVAHASTAEAIRRCVLAGVETIEHGDGGTPEVFQLMAEKGVALCPTLAAGDAILQYRGWRKGIEPDPQRIVQKKLSFKQALEAGVKICFGGDVGVFTHGDNARELEMMVEYGMKPVDALKSATSVNADIFHYANQIGRVKAGLLADLIAVEGNPLQNIKDIRKVKLVMKGGEIVKQ
ncbi:metal-dependent hydrolase family protein [Thermoflexibacter ruber]|uniref:Imidazolonepropionase n=1 Tax=Thermoflexibacter ruber TaxID=1003 RepID=A0A1I2DXZ5_9BACT|nr:amidohydrolase family protein [Thermoflexibacter ruber]SFE85288.1 Imidazolonepropionase [Thermoflexibacter ruber]